MTAPRRVEVRVTGIVQGVGFRPFVHGLAARMGVSGLVGNDAAGVFIEAEGEDRVLSEFLDALRAQAPPLSTVEDVAVTPATPTGDAGFRIVRSGGGAPQTLVSADTATCDDCLREMDDPADRRYGYPFVNCTNCGPRFTIVTGLPYDRPNTTMAPFTLCAACAAEYHDPADRRFHAQPVCCPACGPALRFTAADGAAGRDPLADAAALLAAGGVLAVKGLGGYHLAVDARCEPAAAALRERKHREDKPFAVLVGSVDAARELCVVDSVAEGMLADRRRPIVLLERVDSGTGAEIAHSVAPGNRQLGVLLPYTPMHHLLIRRCPGPIVLTSGNVSDEPIAYTDDDAFARLAPIADGFLHHDRAIHTRTDDSVARPARGRSQLVRRSRGYAPEPLTVADEFPRHVLACGAELKNTFCLAKGRHAFCSHHIGDLENYETLRSFTEGIEHFRELFDVHPEVVAYDLHPDYLSTRYALDCDGVHLEGVQHHHAHIASCLADNKERGPVLGVAFDGTGYGTDGTLWGGEFLLADAREFQRLAHLRPVPLPGGAAAVRQPWRMAASYLELAYSGAVPELDVVRRHRDQWSAVTAMARGEVNAPPTSSVGRLFDAVAAVLGVRDAVNYEGQAAIELEQHADRTVRDGYPVPGEYGDGGATVLDGLALVRSVTDDVLAGSPVPVVAARFHNAVAGAVARTCAALAAGRDIDTVALSGGVFQNVLLSERTVDLLSAAGFRVLTHSRVPCNDGGVSLGQAVVAAARDRQART